MVSVKNLLFLLSLTLMHYLSPVTCYTRFLFISDQSLRRLAGADPGFFLGGSALVSCSTSIPINHIVFFAEYQLY